MKITALDVWQVWNGRNNSVFVTVDTDEGISGVGECGISNREHAISGVIDHFRPVLLGMDPFRNEHIWQLLFRGGFFPAQRIQTTAMSAIDIALWDIKGKALNVPVYDLLGGRARDRVICYPHNGDRSLNVDPLVESCLKSKEEGWKFVRWGLPFEGDVLEPRQSIPAAILQVHACAKPWAMTWRSRLTCTRGLTCPIPFGFAMNWNLIASSLLRTPCAAKIRNPSGRCASGLQPRWQPASNSVRNGSFVN